MTRRIPIFLTIASVVVTLSLFNILTVGAQESDVIPEKDELAESLPEEISFTGFENLKATVLRNSETPEDITLQFSWKLPESVFQTSYQVLLSSTEQYTTDQIGDIWDSGKIPNPQGITYVKEVETFPKDLEDGFYYWQVRVWDNNSIVSQYSEPQRFYLVTGDIFSAINGIPDSPESTFGQATSPSSIRWEFFDRADDETGFAIFDKDGLVTVTTAPEPVSDFYYLEEVELLPNTKYEGRTARTFNPYGFSDGSAPFFPVYTLAAVPGTPWLFSISDSDLKFVIEPNGNPDDTQYALFNSVSNSYLDAQGIESEEEAWLTLAEWQSVILSKESGPYTLSVKARNGDRIETAFSPFAVFAAGEEQEAPVTITLQAATNLPTGEVLGVTAGTIDPFINITSSLSLLLLYSSIALFIMGMLTLMQYVQGGLLDKLRRVPALVTARISDVYDNHIDKRFISKGLYSFLAHSVRVAIVVFGVNAVLHTSALVFGSYTQAQIREPDVLEQFSVSAQSVEPHDTITYLLTVKNNLDEAIENVQVVGTIPHQTELIENSLKALRESTPLGIIDGGVLASFKELRAKERQQFEYTVQVSANDYLGRSIIRAVAVGESADLEILSNAIENELPSTDESYVNGLISLEGDPNIYLIDEYAHRRLFNSQDLYESWFGNDFSRVQSISQNILEHYPAGEPLLYNEGSLVRFTGTDHVYKVTDGEGTLELLSREDVEQLDESDRIFEINPVDFSNYRVLF